MTSINLLIIELVLCLTMIGVLYKKYNTMGMYVYVMVAGILSYIMALKTISVYNYDLNLGIIPFVTIFICSNILIQKKGPDVMKNLILIMIASICIGYIILFIASFLNSSNINLFTSASYDNIFGDSLRMFFTTLVTLLYSMLLNSKLYYYLKKMKNNILISNLFSTIIIQFVAAILFGLIGYIFIREGIEIVKIIMIRYLVSLVIGLVGTSVIYIAKYIKE